MHAFRTALAYLYCSHLASIRAFKPAIEYFQFLFGFNSSWRLICRHSSLDALESYFHHPSVELKKADLGGVSQVSSDVPEGKGVSSSAALEVATMSAIAAAYGKSSAELHWNK